jgi:hypothetical protein
MKNSPGTPITQVNRVVWEFLLIVRLPGESIFFQKNKFNILFTPPDIHYLRIQLLATGKNFTFKIEAGLFAVPHIF